MNTAQLSISFETAPYARHSATSKAAAKAIAPVAGLIRDSGRTRKTASGRDAVVWVVA